MQADGFVPGDVKAHRGGDCGKMRLAKRVLVGMSLGLLVSSNLHAQEYSEQINSNAGGAVSLPLSPTSQFVKTSWGLVGGAGYNFSPHHSVIGEFMWSALYPSGSSLQPIRVALNDNSIDGHSNLYTLTGNYRYQWQGKLLGAYFHRRRRMVLPYARFQGASDVRH
jgi:hypothetical protein